jgi:hypothetical protein
MTCHFPGKTNGVRSSAALFSHGKCARVGEINDGVRPVKVVSTDGRVVSMVGGFFLCVRVSALF